MASKSVPAPSLTDEATARPRKGPRPEIERAAETMPDDFRAEFFAAVLDPRVSPAGLSRALYRRNYDITEAMIKHYRKTHRVGV